MAGEGSTVVQISNISPSASRDQLYHMFSYFGRIQEFKIYPSDANPISAFSQSKICYIRYERPHCVATAQHMTNTVFVDRALVCVPVLDSEIPSEDTALKLGGPSLPGQRQLPPGVTSSIRTIGKRQVTVTHDPKLSAFGLPLYPPLPAQMDESKIEEIRRTIYVGGIPKEADPKDVMQFLNKNIGEVMYLRMAGPDDLPSRFAYVEFSSQHSIPIALQKMGLEYNGSPLEFHHSTVAVVKPQTKLFDHAYMDDQDAQSDMKRANSKERSSHRSRSHRHRCRDHQRRRSKSHRHKSRSSRHSRRSRRRSSDHRRSSRKRSKQRHKSTSRSSRRSESREKNSRHSSKNYKDSADSEKRSRQSREEKESPKEGCVDKERRPSTESPSKGGSTFGSEEEHRESLSGSGNNPEMDLKNDEGDAGSRPHSRKRSLADSSFVDLADQVENNQAEPAEAAACDDRTEAPDFKPPRPSSPSPLRRKLVDKSGKINGSDEEDSSFSQSKRKRSGSAKYSRGRSSKDDDRKTSRKDRKKSERLKERKSKRSKHKHRKRSDSDASRSSGSRQSSD